jgi:hypothetical protein
MDNVTLKTRMMGAGVYDHGYLLGYERVSDHDPRPQAHVIAYGAYVRVRSFRHRGD